MANQDDTLKQINKSGFPFQLRVEHEILRTQGEHIWSVASREHPWTSVDKATSGFIDIVLNGNHNPPLRLVIECKRIKADDATQLRWVFLIPDREQQPTRLASCFQVGIRSGQNHEGKPDWNDIRVWDDVQMLQVSDQSEFCILQNDGQRKQPILESLAAEVLESVEGLAEEEVNVRRSSNQRAWNTLLIFPAIVTNAEIAVCHLDPANIKITDGTLDPEEVKIEIVPFIRFRKTLATSLPPNPFFDLKAANKARERTVFIVNAASLLKFLKYWDVYPEPNGSELKIEQLLHQLHRSV